ncbi:O-methyltransferase [uncultured Traorella sp.]|uniref:O-methyltransferase n=1 Tax=uncultured Traorella sp. TaxID=1929048 RepID=UPI0025E68872|nr:O-methyltransferase [uncultured Traorella sp.]
MDKLIEEMERYAREYDIPIMQKEGLVFFQKLIVENHIKTILEIGSAIGYSAIQLARLDPDMHIVTIERDDERYAKAVENIERSGLTDQIELIHGDALEIDIDGNFDCIFIDAAKAQYIRFFEKYETLLKEDGIIVSDNLSFHGYVEHPERKMSRSLRGLVRKIKNYIVYLENHEKYDTLFINEGDGLAISRKKKTNMVE